MEGWPAGGHDAVRVPVVAEAPGDAFFPCLGISASKSLEAAPLPPARGGGFSLPFPTILLRGGNDSPGSDAYCVKFGFTALSFAFP